MTFVAVQVHMCTRKSKLIFWKEITFRKLTPMASQALKSKLDKLSKLYHGLVSNIEFWFLD